MRAPHELDSPSLSISEKLLLLLRAQMSECSPSSNLFLSEFSSLNPSTSHFSNLSPKQPSDSVYRISLSSVSSGHVLYLSAIEKRALDLRLLFKSSIFLDGEFAFAKLSLLGLIVLFSRLLPFFFSLKMNGYWSKSPFRIVSSITPAHFSTIICWIFPLGSSTTNSSFESI